MLRFLLGLLATPLLLAAAAGPRQVSVRHVLRYEPESSPPRWAITLTVDGLGSTDEPYLELADWGEWTDVDSYVLQDLESDVALAREGHSGRFRILAPDGWDGSLRVSYALLTSVASSRAQQEKGLLPWRTQSYTHGFSANTLMIPGGAGDLELARTLAIHAPDGWTILCGWGGISRTTQEVVVPRAGANTVIAMGRPVGALQQERDGARFEIAQFGGPADLTGPLFEVLSRIASAYAQTTGRPLDAFRVVVTEPGFGGTRVEGAISVGASTGLLEDGLDPGSLHFLAHEMFHHWLPGDREPGNDAMQWFFEGFTDYLSLWHLVRAGLLDGRHFAQRLLDLEGELEANQAWSHVRFADPGVRWRSWPQEEVAYKGGLLLAFHADVTLRASGHAGLSELVRDFLAGDAFDHEWFARWLDEHGLREFRQRCFDGTERPDTLAALEAIGYRRVDAPVQLTYFGVETDDGTGPGRVLAIDPDGPNAGSDLRVGDVVFGYFPARAVPARLPHDLDERYRFGLDRFDPEGSGFYVDVLREGEELQVPLQRVLRAGGLLSRIEPGEVEAFFR